MPEFLVKVHGSRYRMDLDGEVAERSFFVSRFVSASDPDAAVHEALRRVRTDRRLEGQADVVLTVDLVQELPADGAPRPDHQGFVFYDEDDSDEGDAGAA